MTSSNIGGTPAGSPQEGNPPEDLGEQWYALEVALGAYLATMVAPEGDDHLLIELPDPTPDGPGECAPYAQFAAFGDGAMVRAEISGDGYLHPQFHLDEVGCGYLMTAGWSGNDPDDPDTKNWYAERPVAEADDLAEEVVRVLQHHFGVAHPQLLTYHAWGPAAEDADMLGICATEDVPTDDPKAPQGHGCRPVPPAGSTAIVTEDRDELVAVVADVLREKYECEPTVDEDGDFVIQHMDQPVWVRVRPDQPAVELMALVAYGVRSRRATAVEIGLLNRDRLWTRWTLRDRGVWQTLVLPGLPFVPEHLDIFLGIFLQDMSETRDDLALRTGAKGPRT